MTKFLRHFKWDILMLLMVIAICIFIIAAIVANVTKSVSDDSNKNTSEKLPNSPFEEFVSEHTLTEAEIEELNNNDNSEVFTKEELKEMRKKIDFRAKFPYLLRVNKAENFVLVYGKDKETGHYNIPFKAFVCSVGREENFTPLGIFQISDKYRWRLMVDNTWAQYATRIEGQIMFHSVPYLSPSCDTLEYEEYNKLGSPASLGCVRLRVKDIKWIYDKCPAGTSVNIYSSKGEICPIELEKPQKLKKKDKKKVWDPTDPFEGNPWNK